ncbi:MAG: hypothetical protein FJ225_06960 [Lentisphaerae bacterium]|nr:hypothetical protein [Lentisphaerota bacterium]
MKPLRNDAAGERGRAAPRRRGAVRVFRELVPRALSLGLCLLAAGAAGAAPDVADEEDGGPRADEMPFKDLRLPVEYHTNGTIKSQIFASAALVPARRRQHVKARDVRLEFYAADGALESVVRTGYCDYSRESQWIACSAGVRIERPGAMITGDSMRLRITNEEAVVEDNVRIVAAPGVWDGSAAEGPVKWTPGDGGPSGTNCSVAACDVLEYFRRDGMLELRGNVTARGPEFGLSAAELTVWMGEGRSVTRSVARGAVRLEDGRRTANCETATYVRAENRVTLEGGARVDGPGGRMEGRVVVYGLKDERIECEQGTLTLFPGPGGSESLRGVPELRAIADREG